MQNVQIKVSKEPVDNSTVAIKKIPITHKIFNKLFGKKDKMTVIILGKTVANVEITDIDERGKNERRNKINKS